MNSDSIRVFDFSNGLTLLVEPMQHVQSAAFSILTPAGVVRESQGANGTAAALCDLITRGAGQLDSRSLSNALDYLGVQRSENVGWNFLSFSGATLADNLLKVFPYYAEILRSPHLEEDQFPAVMSGVEQGLLAEEDEPQRKVLIELRRRCYDSPWNRPTDGTLAELDQVTYEKTVQHFQAHVRPNGTLIGVAGNVNPEEVRDVIGGLLGDWAPKESQELERIPQLGQSHHIQHSSTQTHIGLAYPAVPYGHVDYYAAWAAVSILSGGSSSRLFTEVRERRGLCYSVYATLHSLLTEGRVLAYAGATTDRAQETLDVMLEVMRNLANDIQPAELERCLARAKSSLIMQQESTGSRASSIARDWFHLGRVTTLHEVRSKLESLSIDEIADCVRRHPLRDLTVLTIGEAPLQLAESI